MSDQENEKRQMKTKVSKAARARKGSTAEDDATETTGNKTKALKNTTTKTGETEGENSKTTTPVPDSPTASTGDSKAATPQTSGEMGEEGKGDVTHSTAAGDSTEGGVDHRLSHARLPGEGRAACWERIRKASRAAGMPRGQGPGTAYEWATMEAERLFPPDPEPEPEPVKTPEMPVETVDLPPPAEDQGVPGLGDLPAEWGQLPANASLQAEVSWVSANRLVVRDGSGVDLSRALSPAPSYSALSWLETSILFPSKFADISVKATQGQEDEKEGVRRETRAIEDIRDMLKEMLGD